MTLQKQKYESARKANEIVEEINHDHLLKNMAVRYAKSEELPTWDHFIAKNNMICCTTRTGVCLADPELNLGMLNCYLRGLK